jgi:hypothetical protein
MVNIAQAPPLVRFVLEGEIQCGIGYLETAGAAPVKKVEVKAPVDPGLFL